MLLSKACDISGIVAIACARHGCFAPNSIVDLIRGEQQKNVDWALLEAVRSTSVSPSQGVMLMYDIACQYYIHLKDRIGTKLPLGLEVDRAIGSFHVHAHKEACFFRYGAAFIPGTGVCAGEILESLWSNLNTITPATRTATLAHRAELIDDHAADSNHKKSLAIGEQNIILFEIIELINPLVDNIIDRFNESQSMVEETINYYDRMTSTIAAADIKQWESEIIQAEEKRLIEPAVMDIIGAQRPDNFNIDVPAEHHLVPVGEDWCRLALSVEERQIDIQDRVRRLGKEPREDERQKVEKLREILIAEISQVLTLESKALEAISRPAITPPKDDNPETFDDLDDEIQVAASETDQPNTTAANSSVIAVSSRTNTNSLSAAATSEATPPERQLVAMPSNCLQDHPLYAVELSLRKQQAERYLNALRDVIAEKSFHFVHVVRNAPKKSVRTRARALITKLNERISLYCRIYTRCRAALVRLSANQSVLDQFQTLQKGDVAASTAILDPNMPGASSLRVSWIWQTSIRGMYQQSPGSVRECM
jgi:hypothetical protein